MLNNQRAFFIALREQVGALVRAKRSGQEISNSIDKINAALKANSTVSRYVQSGEGFASQVQKVYTEMTGQPLPAAQKTARLVRDWHAKAHGVA